MNEKSKHLLCRAMGFALVTALMCGSIPAAAAAGDIGLIDTTDEAEFLNLYTQANETSPILGQIPDETPVLILNRVEGWVQILTENMTGWILADSLAEEEEPEPETETETETEPETVTEPEPETVTEPETEEQTVKEEEQTTETQAISQTAQEETPAEQETALQEAQAQAQALQEAQAQALQEAQAQQAAQAQQDAILAQAGATREDLYLLANLIYCEAGCEPYIGKVAVGNVVMNRVYSDRQPDTISGVIYARRQFSPVSNGTLARALENNRADASCYQAALEALAGAKPIGDKLFFRRVNGRAGQVIGRHVFY